jgi:hypothetical protein
MTQKGHQLLEPPLGHQNQAVADHSVAVTHAYGLNKAIYTYEANDVLECSSSGRPSRCAQLKAAHHIADIVKNFRLPDERALAAVLVASESRPHR